MISKSCSRQAIKKNRIYNKMERKLSIPGIEPRTFRLKVHCSTTELHTSKVSKKGLEPILYSELEPKTNVSAISPFR